LTDADRRLYRPSRIHEKLVPRSGAGAGTSGAARPEVRAVDSVALELRRGELVLITGPSGSGKTTLLLMLGALLRPTSGRIVLNRTGH
jgi:ABC-type lipoprotein export system ATPase subunit